MTMRYSRRRADGITEYSDSAERLAAASDRELDAQAQGCFTVVGLVSGFVVALLLLHSYGNSWPKVVRFSLVIAAGIGGALLLRRWAGVIALLVGLVLALGLLAGVAGLIWSAL
jgi:hypothetical protein